MGRKRTTTAVTGTTRSSVAVLLAEDVSRLGKQGDVVRVKPGYARNYLLPQGLATVASKHNKRMVERHKMRAVEQEAARVKEFRQLADAISKYSVTLEANANPEGHLYGSITAKDISGALKAAGYELDPDFIRLEGPLKELGMYTVKIEMHPKVQSEVKVWVVPTATAET